ncbi:MAG: hypothetical protein AAFQ82_17420, partial [Myxococcota bacterium]
VLVLAIPSPDALAEMAQEIAQRRGETGVARANFEELGGEGELVALEYFAPMGDRMAYSTHLAPGQTLSSVTLRANSDVLPELAAAYDVSEEHMATAMAVVAEAANAEHRAMSIGTGSEVLVVSFAGPNSPFVAMLDEFMDMPEDRRRELAAPFARALAHAEHSEELPVGLAIEALESLGSSTGARVLGAPSDSEDLAPLMARLRQRAVDSAAAGKTESDRPLFSVFDNPRRGRRGADIRRTAHAWQISDLDLADSNRAQAAARQTRSAERFHAELDRLGEQQLRDRLNYRRIVADEIERDEIRRA